LLLPEMLVLLRHGRVSSTSQSLRPHVVETVCAAYSPKRAVFIPPDAVFAKVLEASAEQGRQAVNLALAAAGSPIKFKNVNSKDGQDLEPSEFVVKEERQLNSLFWNPRCAGSPFQMGREAFLAKHLSQSADCKALVPDDDVERYVDTLLEEAVLNNVSLPPPIGRQLYIRVVRIVQRTVINALDLVEGSYLGKELKLLKQKSDFADLRCNHSSDFNSKVIPLLAKRTIDDHKESHPYLMELGIPSTLVEKLYEDIIALSFRLVLDLSCTFQIRCLGHKMTCQISADEMVHKAPGWSVALAEGAFGLFDDTEKRQWAKVFVTDLMQDGSIRMNELPIAVQEQVYQRVALVLLNLAETALNHFRIHVSGMSFRPALLD